MANYVTNTVTKLIVDVFKITITVNAYAYRFENSCYQMNSFDCTVVENDAFCNEKENTYYLDSSCTLCIHNCVT